MKIAIALASGLLLAATPILSQTMSPTPPPVQPQPAPTVPVLPANTVLQLIAPNEISSKDMKVGDMHQVQVANDVVEGGNVVIPRGAPVASVVTWRTGKGIGGKSAKFELTFSTVTVNGKPYKLKGKVRQEGRGNTAAALLGSMIITGKSAVITQGQMMTAITDEPIPIS